MEELQDAIEDAQYMNAMQDTTPKPTKEWKKPTVEEIQKFTAKLLGANPKAFELEGICSGSLGLYMFCKFVSDQGNHSMSSFITDVAAFRSKISANIGVVATKIINDYLVEGSSGNTDSPENRRSDIVRQLPASRRRPQPTQPYQPQPTSSEAVQVVAGQPVDDSSSTPVQPAPTTVPVTAGQETAPTAAPLSPVSSSSATGQPMKWQDYLVLNVEAVTLVTGASPQPVATEPEAVPSINAIRCKGDPVAKVLDIAQNPRLITTSLFDELDAIIFSYLSETYFESFKISPLYSKYLQFMAMTEQVVGEDDFALFRVLGRGGFGMVSGCKRCYSGKLFAMKVMNKRRVKMKKAEALCLNERNILAAVDSAYVVCLKYAFTTQVDLYLVLDLMIGGDLGFHLQRKGSFSIKETKFYAARILLGIGALHDLSIVYRDLKPENILMDEHGYTKISDLGLACRVGRSGLSGTCGTRGYWAPEMLRRDAAGKRERYSLSVDWFSFGCCIYEFIFGISPFRTERARQWGSFPKIEKADKDKAIDLAIQEMEPELDGSFDDTSKDFIRKLLHKDGRARLGARGYREIMLHPWFDEIDFDSLNQVPPPMVPARDINMATQSEIGCFSDDKQSRKIILTEADHKNYDNWQFTSTRAFQEEVVEFLLMEELLGPIKPVGYGQSCCCAVS